MKLFTHFFFYLILSFSLISQENKELTLNSKTLSETRDISIHLPESYNTTSLSYPVIYSLDGEYTQLVVNGTIDYYSYWDKTPECIVVNIHQNYMDTVQHQYKRWSDCSYSWKTGFPKNKGIGFKDFISKELIPFIDSSYRTTSFRAIIGHSFTANFINYFLLENEPLFRGYVAISPYYATNGLDSIKNAIQNLKSPVFYYVANGENDLSGHIKSVEAFDKQFSKQKNENFIYKRFDMKNNQATHYTIFPKALPGAMEHLFSLYNGIDNLEFKEILKVKNKLSYLKTRYQKIEDVYGIKMNIRESDFNLVAFAIAKDKRWEQLKEIGEQTIKMYPDSYSGYWTLGEYEEQMGNYKAALKHFELGYSKLGEDVTNASDFQKDIDRIKRKLK